MAIATSPPYGQRHSRTLLWDETRRMTPVHWIRDEEDFYSAVIRHGTEAAVHAAVEGLGETGWDWHVWDPAERVDPRYGLADTLADGQALAERALSVMLRQLGWAR